jgi:hypothetical protein
MIKRIQALSMAILLSLGITANVAIHAMPEIQAITTTEHNSQEEQDSSEMTWKELAGFLLACSTIFGLLIWAGNKNMQARIAWEQDQVNFFEHLKTLPDAQFKEGVVEVLKKLTLEK